jgi:hypothetical protein
MAHTYVYALGSVSPHSQDDDVDDSLRRVLSHNSVSA